MQPRPDAGAGAASLSSRLRGQVLRVGLEAAYVLEY